MPVRLIPAIPTTRIPMRIPAGHLGRCIMFDKLYTDSLDTLSHPVTGRRSSKRLGFIISVVTLAISCLCVSSAVAYRVASLGDIGAGAAGALLTVCAAVSALAGVGYRKLDVGVAAPPAGYNGARTCVENSPDAESVVPGAKFEGTVKLRAVIAKQEGLERAAYWRGFRDGAITGGATGGYLGYRLWRTP